MDLGTIISLISQKGGVGKSAIARLLAVEFVRAGWSVKIADLDTMQGTVTKWKLRRDAAKLQPEIPVEKFATVARALREAEKYDLVLLDGPAHAEKGGLSMAKKSKLILMPTCYGLDDLEAQIEAAYELEENGIERNRIWFIFSRTTGSTNEEQTAREYLQRADINVLEPVLPELPSIRQSLQRRKGSFGGKFSCHPGACHGARRCRRHETSRIAGSQSGAGRNLSGGCVMSNPLKIAPPPPRRAAIVEAETPALVEAPLQAPTPAVSPVPSNTASKFRQVKEDERVQFNKRVTRRVADGYELLAIRLRKKVPELLAEALDLLEERYGRVG